MKIRLVDDQGRQIQDPYILRLQNWTEERFYKESPEDRKCEYVRGELIVVAAMSMDHSDMVSFLHYLLKGYCEFHSLGKVTLGPTIRLEPEVNREPDICFFSPDQVALAKGMPVEVIPPFVCEVSHTTQSIDLGEKVADYERAGVEEYWVVDVEGQKVYQFTLVEGVYQREVWETGRLVAHVIDGFSLEIEWLWKDPQPSAYRCLQSLLGKDD